MVWARFHHRAGRLPGLDHGADASLGCSSCFDTKFEYRRQLVVEVCAGGRVELLTTSFKMLQFH